MPAAARIRDLDPGDVPHLLVVAIDAWTPVFAGFREALGDRLFELGFPDWRKAKRREIESACRGEHGARVLVAESGGQPVGFAVYYCSDRTHVGELSNNAVAPSHQRRGIGTALYEAAVERMQQAGMKVVTVTTGADAAHAPARRAYRSAGFAAGLVGVTYYRVL